MAKGSPFFQFPLCLLSLPVSEKDLVQHIVSWVLVSKGEAILRKLEKLDEEHERLDGGLVGERLTEVWERLPPGFNEDDRRHLSAAMMLHAWPNVTPGSWDYMIPRYEAAQAHRRRFEEIAGRDVEARLRWNLIWDLNRGILSLREFAVMTGFMAAIGKAAYKVVTFNRLRYLAAGYKSADAYRLVQEASANEPAADLNALNLPDPPPASGIRGGRYSNSDGKPNGYFRWDQAEAYRRLNGEAFGGVPLTGPGGMFEVLLTNRGAVFQLRPEYMPDDGNPTTGRWDMADFYTRGDRVVFDVGTGQHRGYLVIGDIEAVSANALTIRGPGGKLYKQVSRTSSRPAPAAFFEDLISNAEQKPAGLPLLTDSQLKTTRDALLRLKLVHGFYNGRKWRYSPRMTAEDIAAKVLTRDEHKAKAEIRQVRLARVVRERKNALRAELEAEREKLKAARKGNVSEAQPDAPKQTSGRPTGDPLGVFPPPALRRSDPNGDGQ